MTDIEAMIDDLNRMELIMFVGNLISSKEDKNE